MSDLTDRQRFTQRCSSCGEYWWDSHVCPHSVAARQTLPTIDPKAKTVQQMADEIGRLTAERDALLANGPPMRRGTIGDGTPWMGTMREVLEDYKSAAATESALGDEARAEVKALRDRVAVLERGILEALPSSAYMDPPDGGDVDLVEQLGRMAKDAARYRWLRDWAQSSDWESIGWQTDTDKAVDAARAALKGEG